ncbi:phosphocholine-specific phospholipase C [Asaia sp. As-1742]|uniref:phosphocholine-specific phospholipase C n=1 Tax=Asaia sp. As-1742 TaxID=2608325 RepID=UPI0014235BE2|nr:phospholipase C, phosphocholine-specific [Asaia sp. As-1742]NIE80767.1 phospholipase C, phosphocholine-specific [Asaia sp. As-1742]
MKPSRRHFLHLGAAALAGTMLPENLRQALAIPANRETGTIRDVQHVVILMQENRAFDHYFGTLRGVRGFGDPRAEKQADGSPVFAQKDATGRAIWPFLFDTIHTSAACLKSLDHSWKGTQTAWNEWDGWVPPKSPMTMGYFTRAEIPYYYALADAFTICDAYHASIFGPTNPNRLYFFTGTNGLAVGADGKQAVENVDDGNWSADMAHDNPAFTPFDWTTYPERLQEAGVTWKFYQEYDNFGDNPLASFRQFRNLDKQDWRYRQARAVVPGSNKENMHELEGRYLLEAFEKDIVDGTLPQVSWIVPPAALSEHPEAPPGFGEHLISKLIDIFVRHPDTWAKTVFILNYDENDGFFDHVPPPVPSSQIATGQLPDGEAFHGEPVGLGPRVPALIISPWTKGGWVNSQVFDHTSVIRFLEQRFNVPCPTITPWRRAVCGDLTSAFDFSKPDAKWSVALPDTSAYLPQTRISCAHPPPLVPEHGSLPLQEAGQRPSRALPYRFAVTSHADAPTKLVFANTAEQGVAFRIRQTGEASQHLTVAGKTTAVFHCAASGTVEIYGPNGFYRLHDPESRIGLTSQANGSSLQLSLNCAGQGTGANEPVVLLLIDHYTGQRQDLSLQPGQILQHTIPVAASDHWYHADCVTRSGKLVLSLAGHVENGSPSRSDPHFGRGNPA